jgi:putative hemolysin
MLNSGSLLPIPLALLLPPPLQRFAAPLEGALERWVVPQDLLETVREAERAGRGAAFARYLLDQLEIRFAAVPQDLAQIPKRGAAIVVANHPRGIVDGLILTVLLDAVRPDYKLVVNSLLSSVDALRDHSILVNPFQTATAYVENRSPCANAYAG